MNQKNEKQEQVEVTTFVQQVRADDALTKKVGEAGTPEQTAQGIAELAREQGYNFSPDDILKELQKSADDVETLDDDENSEDANNSTMGTP